MNLDYAIDRLYDSGWSPGVATQPCETLSDGRLYPSLTAIHREFEQRGLELTIKHNMVFNTYRATWRPFVEADAQNEQQGTVIGSSECEAAVYALAQLRASNSAPRPLMMA